MKKTILISGASSGFGLAISELLIKEGHQVIGLARRQQRLSEIQDQLGDQFKGIQCDVSELEQVQQALKKITQPIDVLVNNAGFALGLEPAHQSSISDWHQMVQTNITGLLNLTHQVLPGMVSQKNGHIINLGSVAGEYPYPGGNVYGATKAFVDQFTHNLRADLLGHPIRVTNLAPGLCSGTEFSNVRFRGDTEKVKKVYEGIEAITPKNIAEMISWLISTPSHLNVNYLEVMPVMQAFGAFAIFRK